MTYHKIILLLFILLTGCTFKHPAENNKIILDDASETELKKAWTLFAKAIQENDTAKIRELSSDCIHCADCVTNNPIEDSIFINFEKNNPDVWSDKLYNEFCFIPMDDFIRNDLSILFNDKIKSRLQDPSKLAFADNEHNKDLYRKVCIADTIKLDKTKHKEVLLTSTDPSEHYEGAQDVYAFILTGQGFKFCGYSTIP